MITKRDNVFELHTRHTTYAFWVLPTGQLEHLYYGRKINVNAEALTQKHAFAASNTVVIDQDNLHLTLEDERLELSGYGKGDYREPFLELVHPDGSPTSDFRFMSSELRKGKEQMQTLPGSFGTEEEVEHLILFLKDHSYDTELRVHYYVFPECDVITRRAELINHEDGPLVVKRLLSMQLDFADTDYVFTSFHGAHNRDMTEKVERQVGQDKIVVSTYTGVSSNRSNPFTMLSEPGTTEDHGSCYGFNLIYSGNHYTVCEGSAFYQTRVVSGINPQNFCFTLQKEELFETPEAVMTYSCKGFNGMSRHMHKFVQNHIVRGEWAKKERPVLLNSWEAAYFEINEKKLLKLASEAAKVGMELFVMDDGWFGERDNDTKSLGDWTVNAKKLPNGIAGLAEKINALGLDFGIWVEPEMVNADSNLYRAHPDWAMAVPGKDHSEGRNQRILDLCNPEVQDYVIDAMCKVFSSKGVSYVKWDMNRLMSDVYSPYLPAEKQGEVFHRYVMGLYKIMDTLTKKFPHILFEGCASGGCRFDLGILCYFPQIWASDNTDAVCRVRMMTNYSYGYPMSTVTAHVSTCPNHQTLRNTPLETRFNVAAFGVLGYECNLCDMKKQEIEAIKAQVELYKKWRKTMQFGAFYRGRNGNLHEWTVVSPDKATAVGFLMHELMTPNRASHTYYAKGLDPEKLYHFYNRALKHNIKAFGDLVNLVAPVHIKTDSLMQDMVAKFVKMDGEKEEYHVNGDLLMEAGVSLLQAFVTTGYSEFVRFFPDFASRIYFMEEEQGK